MSLFMQTYLIVVLAALGALILFSLLYAVLGKRFTDKIVAANMIGSLHVNIIVILAILIGTDYILDIGLVFALLSFLMVIVLCRFVLNQVTSRMRGEEDAQEEQRTEQEVRE